MDEKTIEIRDDKINVEEIMEKIRENIRRRQNSGYLLPDPDIHSSISGINTGLNTDDTIQRNLAYLHNYWDIQNNSYFISSHRPYFGKFLVKGRNLVHGEVKRYVDPMVDKQRGFNKYAVGVLSDLAREVEKVNEAISGTNQIRDIEKSHLESRLDETEKNLQIASATTNDLKRKILLDVQNAVNAINSDIEQKMHLDVQNAVNAINSDIEQKMHLDVLSAVNAINSDIERKVELAHILEDRIRNADTKEISIDNSSGISGVNYLAFENQFRGSQEDITDRQQKFTRYFSRCNNVLDIGCGRGEFLEILKAQEIGAHGIDIDKSMIDFCRSKGLAVEMADAVIYLSHLDDRSLDGIFIDQVVEHLEPAYLVALLGLCYKKMKEGSRIVIETVNPLSFTSFINFYIDMTHKRPVHPDTLKYLIRSAGFIDIETQFFSPVVDKARLQYLPDDRSHDSESERSRVINNHNIDILNSILFGPQDYTVTGKK